MASSNHQFKDNQRDLLMTICRSYGSNKSELLQACNTFLSNHREHLLILEEKRNIHLNERGRIEYRLLAKEEVPLSMLKEMYSDFAKPLDDFIRHMEALRKQISAAHPALVNALNQCKQEAENIAREMLKISLVLDQQPQCFNYGRKNVDVPNVICLGAECLSNFTITACCLNAVYESDLFSASCAGVPIESVEGFLVDLSAKEDKEKGPKSVAKKKSDCVTKNVGTWLVKKDQLNSTEKKGNAHKDFLRLMYRVEMKYNNIDENVTLLSLPFNIRKSSCQLYTFTGALMWYFYTTSKPYENFTLPDSLSIDKVLKLLMTRIEVIGRGPTSTTAQEFLNKRLQKLFPEGKVELEVLTKSPPTNKEDPNKELKNTRTVDEAIDYYGFFTWFYAVVKTLDPGGYLHKLWMDRYIYDICDIDQIEGVISNPMFGFQVVIFRPSLSQINNYQGEDINVDLAFSFKMYDCRDQVIHLKLSMEEVVENGLYECLSNLPLTLICTEPGVYRSLSDLTLQDESRMRHYHKKFFKLMSVIQLSDNANQKHCQSCRCCGANDESPVGPQSQKKVRMPSGNSDVQISSSSDWQSTNLPYKRKNSSNVSSPTGSQSSMEPSTTTKDSFVCDMRDELAQITSPAGMTQLSKPKGYLEYGSDSPDSGFSADESQIPHFQAILPSECKDISQPAPVITREQLISDCRDVFNSLSLSNFATFSDDEVLELRNYMLRITVSKMNKQMYSMYNAQSTSDVSVSQVEDQFDNNLAPAGIISNGQIPNQYQNGMFSTGVAEEGLGNLNWLEFMPIGYKETNGEINPQDPGVLNNDPMMNNGDDEEWRQFTM